MARGSLEDRNIRSLTKVSGGASYGITLPKEFIRKLKWRSKQKLEITLHLTLLSFSQNYFDVVD